MTKPSPYGIPGYSPPKTMHYVSRKSKFPSSKSSATLLNNQTKTPDPAQYAESFEDNKRRHWTSSYGKFLKSKRETATEQSSKRSRSLPGPGSYTKDTSKSTQ